MNITVKSPHHILPDPMKEEVLQILTDHGTLIEPDAVNYILSQKDPRAFLREFLEGRDALPLVLALKDFRTTESVLSYEPDLEEKALDNVNSQDSGKSLNSPNPVEKVETQTILPEPTIERTAPPRRPANNGVVVITDITGNSTCESNIENFARYFKDRYVTLSRIIRQWQRMRGSTTIANATKREDEVRIIGMVNDIGQTKNGHTTVTVEDDTGSVFVLIPKGNPLQSMSLVKDEVIGIIGQMRKNKGSRNKNNDMMLIPDEIVKPDIPVNKTPGRSHRDIDVLFISDVHVGSSHFLRKEWDRFIDWLVESPEASNVQYMVIAGDLVDGIGIYPDQKKELDIDDVMEQYREVGRLLERVPPHIEMIIQPGNHDAVRPAEPQPALDDEIRAMFNSESNIRFVGNPCFMTIDGVSILSYHGRSVDDLIGDVPELTYQTPILAMREMLKRRHLAPIYGGKTPIAPEDKDYLIINPVPDIFVTGHVHGSGIDTYRGVKMISASAWQSQTPFQLMHNFHPEPAKVVLVKLKSGEHRILDFN